MAKYRDNLPQLNGKLFLVDGGMGTTLIFHSGCKGFPHINLIGGCCGTDHRHIKEIGGKARRARSWID